VKLMLEGVTLAQGAFKARYDLALEGPAVALFGPSGSGKTTLLEAVAGLRRCTGRILLDGRTLQDSGRGIWLPPRERGIGYVPQDLALFPHLDVEANLGYGLTGGGGPDLGAVAEALGLSKRLKAGPERLSGGERRRVALGRALLARPALLLLDEPCANLDVGLRRQVAALLRRMHRAFGVPLLLVSHDPAELRSLCGDVALIDGGRCSGVVTARGLAAHPIPAARRPGAPPRRLPVPAVAPWLEAMC